MLNFLGQFPEMPEDFLHPGGRGGWVPSCAAFGLRHAARAGCGDEARAPNILNGLLRHGWPAAFRPEMAPWARSGIPALRENRGTRQTRRAPLTPRLPRCDSRRLGTHFLPASSLFLQACLQPVKDARGGREAARCALRRGPLFIPSGWPQRAASPGLRQARLPRQRARLAAR
jgi:hypothetical protein